MQQQIAKLLSKAQQNKCASLRHPTFPRRFSLFLGLLCKRSRAESVAGSLSVDAERGAVAAQGRGHEHAHTVRPGSQHHLPVNQKRFPGEACCVFRPGGSVPAAAIQTRFHERWGGSLYVSGAVGVCGWRGGRGVGRCDEGNAHPFLCRNTRSFFWRRDKAAHKHPGHFFVSRNSHKHRAGRFVADDRPWPSSAHDFIPVDLTSAAAKKSRRFFADGE